MLEGVNTHMPLSDDEKTRIREEEWVRLQAREDFKRSTIQTMHQKTFAFGSIFVAVAFALLVLVLRTR